MKRSTYKTAAVSFFRSRDSLPVSIVMIVASIACLSIMIVEMTS